MKLCNCVIIIDRRYFFRSIFVILIVCILLVNSCATIETKRYVEGPYIISTYPSPGDFNISRYTDINIRFSEIMDASSEVGFEVLSRGVKIDGSKRWLESNIVLVFRPYKPLEANGTYQCIIRDGKSKDGKPLVGIPHIWMFTTTR